jgi:hypothetical protein
MRVIYRKIRHARYLYIKSNVEKVWDERYTLGVRYLSKNTVYSELSVEDKSPASSDLFIFTFKDSCLHSNTKIPPKSPY